MHARSIESTGFFFVQNGFIKRDYVGHLAKIITRKSWSNDVMREVECECYLSSPCLQQGSKMAKSLSDSGGGASSLGGGACSSPAGSNSESNSSWDSCVHSGGGPGEGTSVGATQER